MKVSLGIFWIVLFITVFAQFGSSKIVSKREESNYENGTDVVLTEPGILDVILASPNLTFGFCDNKCVGDFLLCYEPSSADQNSTKLCDSKCGLYVDTNEKTITIMYPYAARVYGFGKRNFCYEATMMKKETEMSDGHFIPTCIPKIENGIVKLNITRATSNCPVTIKNAKLYKEEKEVSTPNPSSPESSNTPTLPPGSSATPTSKIMGNCFGWFFVLLISFYLLH